MSVTRLPDFVDGNFLTDTSTTREALPPNEIVFDLRDTPATNDPTGTKQLEFKVDLTYHTAPQEDDPMYPIEYEGRLVRGVYEVELAADDGRVSTPTVGKQMVIIASDLTARDLASEPLLTAVQVCDGQCNDQVREEDEYVYRAMLTRGTAGGRTQGVRLLGLNLVETTNLKVWYESVNMMPKLSYNATNCVVKKSGDMDDEGNDLDYMTC